MEPLPPDLAPQLLMAQLPVGLALCDPGGEVRWTNPAARDLLGDRARWVRGPGAGGRFEPGPRRPCAVRAGELEGGGGTLVVLWEAEGDPLRDRVAALADESGSLAHEIKNPVTAVHLALRAVGRALGEDEVEVLEDLVTRLRGVEQRVRDLLD